MKKDAFKIGDIVKIKLSTSGKSGKVGKIVKIDKWGKDDFKVAVKIEGQEKPSWYMFKSSLELIGWRIA